MGCHRPDDAFFVIGKLRFGIQAFITEFGVVDKDDLMALLAVVGENVFQHAYQFWVFDL